jgi:hypothetical protein
LGRVAENAGSTQVPLSADEITELDAIEGRFGVHGDRYGEANMRLVGR